MKVIAPGKITITVEGSSPTALEKLLDALDRKGDIQAQSAWSPRW